MDKVANVGIPTYVADLKEGDVIYIGNRRTIEVAFEPIKEFGGYSILDTEGNHHWYRGDTRVRKKVILRDDTMLYCTLVCPRGHDRHRYSRSEDGGFTFICVKCQWG